MGDPSDNYKGVKGIGPKTACELIKMYGSIEEIYKKIDTVANPRVQSLLIAEKEHALLSKQLATLVLSLIHI